MAYVPVPRDLTKVKTKIAFNLTFRQLMCFGSAALVGFPTYFLARGAVGNTAAVLVMIAVMLPAFFIAMYEKDGQPAEKILRNIIRAKLIFPSRRLYKTDNFYSQIEKEGGLGSKKPQTSKARTASIGKHPSSKAKQKRPSGH